MFGRKAARILELEAEVAEYKTQLEGKRDIILALEKDNVRLEKEVVGLTRDIRDLRMEKQSTETVLRSVRDALDVPEGEDIILTALSRMDDYRGAQTMLEGCSKLLEAGEKFYQARAEAFKLAFEPMPKKAKRG